MIAADTNVVLRLFVQDDEVQSKAAIRLFSEHTVWIESNVILECEWVLRSALEFSRKDICRFIDTLINLEAVATPDYELLANALEAYRHGMDFADALHLYSASQENIPFYTFDKKLVKLANQLNESAILLR